MAKLDSLIVDLQLNTAELRKGLDQANAQLKSFGEKVDDLAGVITFEKIGGAAVDAAKSLVTFTLHGAELADKMGKMAQSAGVSVESFSQMAYAAKLSDVSAEELSVSFTKLNKNISDAATGSKEQVALFGALGVKVTEAGGKVRATDVVMRDLAAVFATMADGASKTKLAVDLFGKSGAQLIPLLNAGADGFAQAAAESDRFGFTVSGPAAAAAEKFNDNLTKLQTAFESIGTRAAAELTPALSALTDQLLTAKDGTNALKDAAEVLAAFLRVLASAGIVVAAVFEAVGKNIGAAASAAAGLFTGNLEAVADLAGNQYDGIVGAASKAAERLKAVWSTTSDETKKQSAVSQTAADEIAAKLEKLKKAATEYESAMKELTKVAESYENKVASFGAGPLEELERRFDSGDLAKKLEQVGDKADDMKLRILAAAHALEQLQMSELNIKLELDRERKMSNVQEDARRKTADFNTFTPGTTDRRFVEMHTAGFKDFDDAMAKYVEATNRQTKAMADAQMFKLANDLEAANASEMIADEFGRAAGDAERAASGFEKLRDIDWQKAHDKLEKMTTAIGALASQLVGKLGELGSVIQSGVQGFQQGGWWGALIAVVIELFSRFERFSELLEFGNNQLMQIIDQLKPAFEELANGLMQFMKMSGVITRAIFQGIGPVIQIIGRIIEKVTSVLTPILSTITASLESIQMITDSLTSIVDSMGIFEMILKGISFVFNGLSLAMLAINYGLFTVWGWILGAVRDVMKFFLLDTTELEQTIATHAAKTAEIRDRMDRISQNMTDPNAAANVATPVEPIDTTGPQIDIDTLGDAAKDAASSLDQFTQQLTNVPEGFKYQLRAFESMNPTETRFNVERTDVIINVNGSLIRESEMKDWLSRLFNQSSFRSSGTPATGNYR